MAEINVLTAVREALHEEMARDESVVILGEDVGVEGGVFRATEGLLKTFGADRVVDTPLAEAAIVGVAIGATVTGLRPVAEIQFADFIWPAMDQIVNEAAKWRYRTNGLSGCPIVIRVPYGGGIHGGPYHSQCVESAFFHIAGLKIAVPATPYDVKGMLKAAIRDPDPVLFFEHKRMYRLIKSEVPLGDYVVELGKAAVRRPGRDLTVVTYGMEVHHCLRAAEDVAKEGIDVEVIDLRTLAPLDRETILESVKRTSKALIVMRTRSRAGSALRSPRSSRSMRSQTSMGRSCALHRRISPPCRSARHSRILRCRTRPKSLPQCENSRRIRSGHGRCDHHARSGGDGGGGHDWPLAEARG